MLKCKYRYCIDKVKTVGATMEESGLYVYLHKILRYTVQYKAPRDRENCIFWYTMYFTGV
jgi:hypothetical protein